MPKGADLLFLDEIINRKRETLSRRKTKVPLNELEARIRDLPPPKDFKSAISREKTLKAISSASGGPSAIRLIAEIKRASPSKGIIREEFDPASLACSYQEGGARAISVLTEESYFHGDLGHLSMVRKASDLPILCKDFIIDLYQIYEARAFGSDAILLIVSILSSSEIKDFMAVTEELDMESLVEVHTEEELEQALGAGAGIIGINNRDLRTFQVSLDTTITLARQIPNSKVIVSESGIKTRDDVLYLMDAGIDAILVGEALMRSPDVKGKIKELLGAQND